MEKITKAEINRFRKKGERKLDKWWIEIIKKKFNNKCYVCGDNKLLHVHHLIPREKKETRWHPSNGVLLCAKCHKYSLYISAHRSAFLFYFKLLNERKDELNELVDFYIEHSQDAQIEYATLITKKEVNQ